MDEGTVYGRSMATIELEKALKLENRKMSSFDSMKAMLNLKKDLSALQQNSSKNHKTGSTKLPGIFSNRKNQRTGNASL